MLRPVSLPWLHSQAVPLRAVLYRWVPFMGNGKKKESQTSIAKVDKNNPFGPITGPVYYGLEMRIKLTRR